MTLKERTDQGQGCLLLHCLEKSLSLMIIESINLMKYANVLFRN